MVASNVVVWAWLPITLSAVAAQAQGNDIGSLGQFLVPGSAAASVIASIWLFINRMTRAGEENAANIKNIIDAHAASMTMLAARLEENTAAIQEMNRWIRDSNQRGK